MFKEWKFIILFAIFNIQQEILNVQGMVYSFFVVFAGGLGGSKQNGDQFLGFLQEGFK